MVQPGNQPQLKPRMARRHRSPAVTAADPPPPLPRRRLSAATAPPPSPQPIHRRHSLAAAAAISPPPLPPSPQPIHRRRSLAAAAAVSATDAVTVISATAIASSPAPRIDAGVDWSGLPPEILHLISHFLTNIWEYLRFRAVSSSWRSSCTARPPQIPSLLLPYDPNTTARSFLDPVDFRVHTINIPEARGKWIYGTPHGWLVMLMANKMRPEYEVEVSLLNPITRDRISLPPLPRDAVHMNELTSMGFAIYTKPFLSANPNSSTHAHFLALLVMYERLLVFCRLGGDNWTVVDVDVDIGIVAVDFTYFNGAFYVVNDHSGITVVNATTLKNTYTAPPTHRPRNATGNFYLVESSGDLLLLERTSRGSVPVTDVFKLDNTGKKLKWARITEGIGDRVLFVSCNWSSISLTSCDYIRSRGDVICFAGRDSCKEDYDNMVADISISDIVAGSSTGKQRYWQDSNRGPCGANCLLGFTWIIPSLC